MSDKSASSDDRCDICHIYGGTHKMGCPNRPGYGDRLIFTTNLPEANHE